jgi:EAL domain-containing protein (putative c-di-GMP-specific phosphodiesterase class I)
MRIYNRDAEVKLVESLTDIAQAPDGWACVIFAFSRLLEDHRSENQLRIATNLIKDLLHDKESMLYICKDSTFFVLTRDTSRALIDKLIFQLRYLYMDDPLAYDHEGEENPDFFRLFDLSRSFDDMLIIAKNRLSNRIKGVTSGNPQAPANGTKKSSAASTENKSLPALNIGSRDDSLVFNAALLANMERDLSNADLSKVMRRQPICAAVPDTMVRRVFDEYYINIAHLKRMLRTEANITGNRWLFNYLTQILDGRMLSMLERSPARYLDNPISLNLNIMTLLSEDFNRFDASIKPAVKFSIVIEIHLADVFADMSAFLTAKSHVQKLGYRVCLDGVTDLSFTQIDRKKLGFDLIKLQWNADIHDDVTSAANIELAQAIKNCGANRVILTRCDNRSAIDYGQAMGISLFQGRYLDSLINPKSTIEN